MISLFAFDLYGTLADIQTDESDMRVWNSLASFMGYHGADYQGWELREKYSSLIDSQKDTIKNELCIDIEDLEIDLEKVFSALYENKGVKYAPYTVLMTAKAFRAMSTVKKFALYNGAKEMLRELKYKYVKTALLSNAQTCFTLPEIKSTGIDMLFDKIFISSEYKIKKPSHGFFIPLIEWANSLGIGKEEIMMTGNSPYDDIKPARELGLRTCFIRSELTERGAETPAADIVLNEPDMKELEKRLLSFT